MKDQTEIKAIVAREIANAIGADGGELASNRADALKYYHCDPRGDEIKGRSQVISSDVADVIEWIKPQCIETFVASDKIVRFDAVGAEDAEQADQESDYVNYVVTKENDAFSVFASLINDCLLQKNGYVKIYWQEPTREREQYEGLTLDEVSQIVSDPDVEIIEHSSEDGELHDIAIHRTDRPGKVQIDPVPPEEMLIARGHNAVSPDNCRFVAHKRDVPASDLIEQGYDRKTVESLPTAGTDEDAESVARRNPSDDNEVYAPGDEAMRLVRVYECYIRIDEDDDGIAELRQIIYAGNEILDDNEVDRIPFAAATPIFQPHTHYGLSIYDRIKQIQDQKTALKRQLLDNLYLINNQRTYVNVNAGVNFADLLTNRPGGIVRGETTMMEAIAPIQTMPLPMQSFEMLGYLDREREERSGVGAESMGQNHDIANDTAHGIERVMSAKEKLVGLIIRTIAETGVKSMFLQVRELLMKHQDKEKVVQLRGKWVQVNPCEWKKRYNTTVKVGLGTGDQLKKQSGMQMVMMLQEKLLAGGKANMVSDANLYKALDDAARYSDLQAEAYFTDPSSPEAQQAAQAMAQQPPPPDPQMEAVKAQVEIDRMKTQQAAEKAAMDAQLKSRELDIKAYEAETARFTATSAAMSPEQVQQMIIQTLAQLQNSPDVYP